MERKQATGLEAVDSHSSCEECQSYRLHKVGIGDIMIRVFHRGLGCWSCYFLYEKHSLQVLKQLLIATVHVRNVNPTCCARLVCGDMTIRAFLRGLVVGPLCYFLYEKHKLQVLKQLLIATVHVRNVNPTCCARLVCGDMTIRAFLRGLVVGPLCYFLYEKHKLQVLKQVLIATVHVRNVRPTDYTGLV